MNFAAQKSSDWIVFKRVMASAMPFKKKILSLNLAVLTNPIFYRSAIFGSTKLSMSTSSKDKKDTLFWMAGLFIAVLVINVVMKYFLFTSHLFWANQL